MYQWTKQNQTLVLAAGCTVREKYLTFTSKGRRTMFEGAKFTIGKLTKLKSLAKLMEGHKMVNGQHLYSAFIHLYRLVLKAL